MARSLKTGSLIGHAASTHRRELREALEAKPNDRQLMLEEIKQMFQNNELYYYWYNRVHDTYRSKGLHRRYEQVIRRKYRDMKKRLEKETPSDPPAPSPVSDADISENKAYTALDEVLGTEGATQREMESVVELFLGREISYKNRHVTGHVCPNCGYVLTVSERTFNTVNPDRPLYTRRLTCPGYFESGCTYREEFTPEIRALLDAKIVILENSEMEI